jgi:hypothetical protein
MRIPHSLPLSPSLSLSLSLLVSSFYAFTAPGPLQEIVRGFCESALPSLFHPPG